MLKSLYPVYVIAHREIRDQFRDWRIVFPIIILTILFPFLMNYTAQEMLGFVGKYGGEIVGERLIPFLLMIVGFFPSSFSLIIALETFVGEKERGSIEPLLSTPLEDWQLYLGKLSSAVVPPLFGSFLGMTVYLTGLAIGRAPLPDGEMMALIILLTIVQAVMMVSGAVVVSCQATSVRAANLLSSFIIIPVTLLIQGESMLMFWGNYGTLWMAFFGVILLTFLLMRMGLAYFRREELLGREIDVLNLRWGWMTFWQAFTGGAKNVWQWYRRVIPKTLAALRLPFVIVFLMGAAGVAIGFSLVRQFPIIAPPEMFTNLEERLGLLTEAFKPGTFGPVLMIFGNNLRVMALALLLGIFSFAVLGVLPIIVTLAVVGYILGILGLNGLPAGAFFAGLILPHAWLEIPAALLATAAVLRSGALLATPAQGKKIGQVWLESLAVWAQMMIRIVIPALFIAAMIEVWITPHLASLILR